jgi:O-acetyl-ADP-ribose deacetylase (regulator of RNase III)
MRSVRKRTPWLATCSSTGPELTLSRYENVYILDVRSMVMGSISDRVYGVAWVFVRRIAIANVSSFRNALLSKYRKP